MATSLVFALKLGPVHLLGHPSTKFHRTFSSPVSLHSTIEPFLRSTVPSALFFRQANSSASSVTPRLRVMFEYLLSPGSLRAVSFFSSPARAPATTTDAYGALLEQARHALVVGRFELAAQLARQLQRDFPDRPAGAALVEKIAAAKAAGRGNLTLAMKHLRRAIELDPMDRAAWHALAESMRLAGDRSGRARLATEYEKRFGEKLPEARP